MFKCMEIAGYIYEGVVYPSYKTSTMSDATSAFHSSKKRV